MSNKQNLTPELRFPEFKNEGDWTENKISELGETINGLTGKNGEDFGTGKSYVTYKQVFDNSVIDFQKCGKVEINDNENQNTLQKGDILFTTSSETPNEVGFASVLVDSPKEDIYLNSFCFALRPFELEKTQPEFTRYLFHSPVYRKSVSAIAQGSTRYNLSKVAFLNLKVPIPKPKEQEKIAYTLSSLDEVIEAQSKKLDLLKGHKKGLMQNLFPQEGKKVPKYRFNEFEKDGAWMLKEVDDFIDLFSGIALKGEEICDDESGIPILRGINITEGYIRHSKEIDKYYLGSLEKLKRYFVKENDIVIAMDGSKVGKNVALVGKSDENAILIQRVARIRANKKADFSFIYQFFISDNFRTYVDSVNTSSGIPHISAQQIKNYKVWFPPNLKEQQKIASCLSALDDVITAQTERIEELKHHKSGLMQGLFPKMIE
jgi:type I restriction enzyme S subunit